MFRNSCLNINLIEAYSQDGLISRFIDLNWLINKYRRKVQYKLTAKRNCNFSDIGVKHQTNPPMEAQ